MYGLGRPPKILPIIQGGWHCGFQDANGFGCDTGSITRDRQLSETRRLLTSFFDLYLKADAAAINSVWGDELQNATTTAQRNSGIGLSPEFQSVTAAVGENLQISVSVTNQFASPRSFKIEAAQHRWIVRISPATTPTIAPGSSTTVTLSTRRLWKNPDLLDTIKVSVTPVGDHLTASFAKIQLN